MRKLEKANVKKCLDVLRDFQESVPVDEANEVLNMKKVLAGQAVDHLTKIIINNGGPPIKVKCDEDHPR
jgi:hypothetical protein